MQRQTIKRSPFFGTVNTLAAATITIGNGLLAKIAFEQFKYSYQHAAEDGEGSALFLNGMLAGLCCAGFSVGACAAFLFAFNAYHYYRGIRNPQESKTSEMTSVVTHQPVEMPALEAPVTHEEKVSLPINLAKSVAATTFQATLTGPLAVFSARLLAGGIAVLSNESEEMMPYGILLLIGGLGVGLATLGLTALNIAGIKNKMTPVFQGYQSWFFKNRDEKTATDPLLTPQPSYH